MRSWWWGAPRAARGVARSAAQILLALAIAALAAAVTHPALRAGVTSLRFSADILRDLGIELVDVAASEAPLREGALGFALDAAHSQAVFDAVGIDFEGFASADLRHAGGFALRLSGERIDFSGFHLRETAAPHALELRDAQDRRWFLVDKPHALLTADLLSISEADLAIAPELAAALGRADLAETYIGVLDLRLSLAAQEARAAAVAPLAAGDCIPDFGDPVDLVMLQLANMTQAVREPGGRVAMAPNATVRNLGPGDVQWYRAILPSTPVGPHPYLALHFYRLAGGVLEQIGRADLKHTFFATNTNCPCPGDQVLYASCEDLYGISTNLDRANLAPRSEIDARTLAWSSLGSHFDGVPVDNVRSHGGDSAHDSFEHRLVVKEPDLQTPGARYFYDGWYMAPNDSNLLNSMGHREVAPAFSGSTWTFPTIDGGIHNGSIVDVFVDPQNVLPGQATQLADTGAGRVQLAVVTSAVGIGLYHYEYALMNFDVERQIRSFAVPIGMGKMVSSAGFADANGNPLDDWTWSVQGLHVVWTAPPGNALDWGTLYNFRMTVNAAPVPSAATLTPLDPGTPAELAVQTLPEPDVGASNAFSLALLALLARRRARS
jgi:hypothetical protein